MILVFVKSTKKLTTTASYLKDNNRNDVIQELIEIG